jgi:hypothetical protein
MTTAFQSDAFQSNAFQILGGVTGTNNNQYLDIVLDDILATINQGLEHSQALSITLDDISVTINQTNSSAAPVVVQPSGGISHAKKRYYIERNGKRIFFYDESEVYDLLYAEEEKLVKKAKKAIQEVVKENVTLEQVQAIVAPRIVFKFNDVQINKDIALINKRIEDAFMKALMRRVEEVEEEEILLALLFI